LRVHHVRLTDLSSRTNKQGDRFDLAVTEDVKVGPLS